MAREIAALRSRTGSRSPSVSNPVAESLVPLVTKVTGVEATPAVRGAPRAGAARHVARRRTIWRGCWSAERGRRRLVLRDLPLLTGEARTCTLKRGLDHLRSGGIVLAVLDGPLAAVAPAA